MVKHFTDFGIFAPKHFTDFGKIRSKHFADFGIFVPKHFTDFGKIRSKYFFTPPLSVHQTGGWCDGLSWHHASIKIMRSNYSEIECLDLI